MSAGCTGGLSCRVRGALAGLILGMALAACGGGASAGSSPTDQSFVSAVHVAAPDIGTYRTNVQLIRLGHAACEDFSSGASYEQLADRLMLSEGSNPIPSEDLGAVINAAVEAYCPQFTSKIG